MVLDGYKTYQDDRLVRYVMSDHWCTPETNLIIYVNYNRKIKMIF